MEQNVFNSSDNAQEFYRRDYFAAHAPKMPKWFKGNDSALSPIHPRPLPFDDVFGWESKHPFIEIIKAFYVDGNDEWISFDEVEDDFFKEENWNKEDVKAKIDHIKSEMLEWHEELRLHEQSQQQRKIEIEAQWRYAYADAMESQR